MYNNKNNIWIQGGLSAILTIGTLFFLLCSFNYSALYAQDSLKIERQKQQINLLENLLETFIKRDDSLWKINGKVNSLELSQWGILFFIPISLKSQANILLYVPDNGKNENQQNSGVNTDSVKNELRDTLVKFLREYTHTLTWLKSDDHIMIVVQENPASQINKLIGFGVTTRKTTAASTPIKESEKETNLNFSLAVTNRTVEDYRKQRIDKEEFNKHVDYKELNETAKKENYEFYKAIQTLETGFRSIIQQANNHSFDDDNIRNIYIPNYGVIYTINAPDRFMNFNFLGFDSSTVLFAQKTIKNALSGIKIDSLADSSLRKGGAEAALYRAKELSIRMGKLLEKTKGMTSPTPPSFNFHLPAFTDSIKPETLNLIKENLITILANFGHTLSLLKDSEHVTILLSSSGMFSPFQTQRKMMISATMGDIQNYHRQKITFEQFKERVKIQNY